MTPKEIIVYYCMDCEKHSAQKLILYVVDKYTPSQELLYLY